MLTRCVQDRGGRSIRLLGPVIHNDTVNEWFRSRGAVILDEDRILDILQVGGPGDIVVIPAFGVPLELAEELRRRYPAEQIVDTTCRDVQAVWRFLEGLAGPDWTVLLHGKPGHPETRATLSRALRHSRRVVVIQGREQTELACAALASDCWQALPRAQCHESVPLPPARGPVAVVNQTTMLYTETMALGTAVETACRALQRPCRVADSVCRATQDRQDAARELCRQHPDVVLVVGGFASSNTAQLLRLAREWAPACLIPSAAALTPDCVTHWVPEEGLRRTRGWLPPGWRRVGVLAGASCPVHDVGEVIRWFRRLSAEAAAGQPSAGGRT
jgi:4-hydroxy-3-methylbut-2-enyl diphosphate reductase